MYNTLWLYFHGGFHSIQHLLFLITLLETYQIKKYEMFGACDMYGGREVHMGFWWGYVRERYCLEDLSVNGRTVLKLSSRNRMEEHGVGYYEHGNDCLGPWMEGNFLTRWTYLSRVSQVWDIHSLQQIVFTMLKDVDG